MKKTKKEIEVEEKLLRTIFVGNLSTTVKKKRITREFSEFGKVASACLRSVALIDVSSSSVVIPLESFPFVCKCNQILSYCIFFCAFVLILITVLHHLVSRRNILNNVYVVSRQSSHKRLQLSPDSSMKSAIGFIPHRFLVLSCTSAVKTTPHVSCILGTCMVCSSGFN